MHFLPANNSSKHLDWNSYEHGHTLLAEQCQLPASSFWKAVSTALPCLFLYYSLIKPTSIPYMFLPHHTIGSHLFVSLPSSVSSEWEEASFFRRSFLRTLFHEESSSLSWASTESSLWGSWEVPFSTQTCKGSLHPVFQYINECGEQWQPQHQLLSNASSHQLPAGLRTTDHRQYPSEPNIQLIFSH